MCVCVSLSVRACKSLFCQFVKLFPPPPSRPLPLQLVSERLAAVTALAETDGEGVAVELETLQALAGILTPK